MSKVDLSPQVPQEKKGQKKKKNAERISFPSKLILGVNQGNY